MRAHLEPIILKTARFQTGVICPECHRLNFMMKHKSLVYCESCESIHTIEEIFHHTVIQYIHLTNDIKLTKAKIQHFSNYFFTQYQLQKLFPKSKKQTFQFLIV
ncbi:hypothetical protein [Macrococcoides caseolyticum]|uniref:hypothetical protein n=1 Tax=Macrococcoides caseolyticum TaxID=69966 RepID=UPI001F35924D|nr:hypothetical protein [Macrococcus caseolyticus]MCE4956907.1 hypothetical protein [Macrococcus caseolyticus]